MARVSRNSWARFAPIERVVHEGRTFSFVGLAELPDFPASSQDESYTVGANDYIEMIAFDRYGSELLWWVIAHVNDFTFPDAEMVEGVVIRIPSPSVVRDVLGVGRG